MNCGSHVTHRSTILLSPACTRKFRVSMMVSGAEAEVELSLNRSTRSQDTYMNYRGFGVDSAARLWRALSY